MRKNHFHAVVFDFDGLILDTETPEYESWVSVFREHDAELALDVWCDVIGRDASAFEPYAYLEQCIGRAVDRDMIRSRRRTQFDHLMQDAALRPGVESYLAKAKQLGLRIGLASSGSRDWVIPHLHRYGIFETFDCIRVREDVRFAKPDPELYESVLACMGVGAERSVAFEDSPNSALAARRGG